MIMLARFHTCDEADTFLNALSRAVVSLRPIRSSLSIAKAE
jgi:hypothetical protein